MESLQKALKKYFGYDNFRLGQDEIITSILNGNDTLAVMPTGGGKSICYQLPALLQNGTAIVISPLIALMKDQVDALQKRGFSAELINSSISYPEIVNRLEAAVNGYFKLLYIAPERLETRSFLNKLREIDVSFIAVDEAHCISEWGHDFRPSYLNIANSIKNIARPPIIALTATATPEVRVDIISSLDMKNARSFVRGFDRPNLIYRVEKPKDKHKRLQELIEKSNSGSTIIYCGSRKRVEKTAEILREHNIKADAYHGGMKQIVRKSVQEKFISGKSNVICATNAFGMGIDKPDVRRVIHTDITLTLEAYYQEAGRAGRDGKQSICSVLYDEKDIKLQEFFINATYPTIDEFQKLYLILKKHSDRNSIILSNLPNLANESGLPIYLAHNILENFEKNGVVSKKTSSTNTEIRFRAEPERIKEYIEFTSQDRREVLEALLRSVNRSAFEEYVEVEFDKIKREQLFGINDIDKIVKSLSYDNILDFQESGSAAGYKLNINLPSVSSLPVDFESIIKRKDLAFNKLNQVIDYIETPECKRNFILGYFGESKYKKDCDKCSSCSNDSNAYSFEKNEIKTRLQVLKCAKEIENKFQRQTLIDILTGKRTPQIKSFDLDQLEYFNILGKQKTNYVENIINVLLNRKYLEISSEEFRPIAVTKIGNEFINDYLKIKETKDMSEEKQFDEKLYNRLVKLRTEIAENAGVVPRGIVSDIVLKKITDSKPLDDDQMRSISGISQLFTEKYGHLFIKEINDYELGNSFDPSKLSKLAKDTLKLVEQGLTFEKITKRMFNNKQMVANNLFEAINEGANLKVSQFFEKDEFDTLIAVVESDPDCSVKELYSKSDIDIDEDLFKIGYALAKKELMRRSKNLKASN